VELCYAITRHAFEVNDSDGKYYGSMVYMNFKRIPVDYVRHLIASRKPQAASRKPQAASRKTKRPRQ
jgi:hypothetical protein